VPVITRWFIKTSLLYLLAALIVGVVQASAAPRFAAAVAPAHIHLLVVGWITQIVFGVAYWMFPRYTKEVPRGSNQLAIASYVALNAGLLLRVIAEPAHALDPGAGWGWTLPVSAFLQWLGGMAFVFNTWPRVKER
jgi:cbb3-type cytochrome oxidase subunit 1